MHLTTVVVKDILRRKTKLLLAVSGVVVAISAFVAISTIFTAAEDSLWDESAKYGANIIVKPRIDEVPLFAGSTTVGSLFAGENYLNESDLPMIRTIENSANIAVVAPKLYGVVEVSGVRVVIMGINTTEERLLKPWWMIMGNWPEEGEFLAGSDISNRIGLEEGMSYDIIGSSSRQLKFSGVLGPTGATEDSFIIAPLSDVQKILDKPGLVSTAEIRALCNDCPVEKMSGQIEGKLPGVEARAISQIVMGEMTMMEKTKSSAMAVAIVTLFVSAMTVASTMLAAINEKTKEIGIMRAVGASDAQVISMVMLEGGIIGIIGGLVGFVAGSAAAVLIGPALIEYTPYPLYGLLPGVTFLSIVISMVAAYIPARRALEINPVEVLRDV